MERSILGKFTRYASLNILGMLGLSLYILADTFFVAQAIGATGLAALNFSIPVYNIIHGTGLMIGIGGATRFSILRSQQQKNKADTAFATSVKVGLIIGLIFALIGLFGSKYIALAMGADSTTLALTQTYLATILVFAPFFILNNVVLAFVRNDNNPRLPMMGMLVGSFANIILDYVFLFIYDMGMFGAALATCLAPIISLCVLMNHFVGKHNKFGFLRNKLIWSFIPDIFSLGLSAYIVEVSSAIVLITFNWVILGLAGNIGVAAYGIIANLALVGIAIFTGLAQGMQPLASKYYGFKRYDLVKKVRKYALVGATLLGLAMYFGITLYADNIVAIFNSDNNMRIADIAGTGLRIYFLGVFFAGLNIVAAMFLSAIENAMDAFIISIARGFGLVVPLVIVMSKIWGMTGVWSSFVLTEFVVVLLAIYLARLRAKESLPGKG